MKRMIVAAIICCLFLVPFRSAGADVFYWESEYNTLAEKLMMTEENLSDLEEKYEKDTKELEKQINELKKQVNELNSKVETLQLVIRSKN